jgi:hypothetical protein
MSRRGWRLLAEPGGICISRVVRDQIRDKLPYAFEDMGEQGVKNIARPVRAYAMGPRANELRHYQSNRDHDRALFGIVCPRDYRRPAASAWPYLRRIQLMPDGEVSISRPTKACPYHVWQYANLIRCRPLKTEVGHGI